MYYDTLERFFTLINLNLLQKLTPKVGTEVKINQQYK